MDEPLKFFKGDTDPPIASIIEQDGDEEDLNGASVAFKLRPISSQILKVDAGAVIVDADEGTVKYDWGVNDLNTPGHYYYRWVVTHGSGRIQSTPEELLIVDDHSEGTGVYFGEIADRVKGYLPMTFDRLRDERVYGDRRIQRMVDLIKFKLFNTVVNATNEQNLYNPMVLDYAAKATTVNLIPAAIEFWASQHQSINTQGTQESVSYPDRIRALQELQERLLAELAAERPDIAVQVPVVVRRRARLPMVDTSAEDMRTAEPATFPRLWATTHKVLWDL